MKSSGISPFVAIMNERFASPYIVALTAEAVASSAAMARRMNPHSPIAVRAASASTWPWFSVISAFDISITTNALIST